MKTFVIGSSHVTWLRKFIEKGNDWNLGDHVVKITPSDCTIGIFGDCRPRWIHKIILRYSLSVTSHMPEFSTSISYTTSTGRSVGLVHNTYRTVCSIYHNHISYSPIYHIFIYKKKSMN
jgi:hypothetical protein